jgi:hypothetical protein
MQHEIGVRKLVFSSKCKDLPLEWFSVKLKASVVIFDGEVNVCPPT